MSARQSGVSIKQAAGEEAFGSWCLVYVRCYQEAGSKVGIYNGAARKEKKIPHDSEFKLDKADTYVAPHLKWNLYLPASLFTSLSSEVEKVDRHLELLF